MEILGELHMYMQWMNSWAIARSSSVFCFHRVFEECDKQEELKCHTEKDKGVRLNFRTAGCDYN